MKIDGMQGVQLYDLELTFGGQYVGSVEAVFFETEGQGSPLEVFSGNPSKTYDEATNTTKVMGRCSCPPFDSDSFASITILVSPIAPEFQLRG